MEKNKFAYPLLVGLLFLVLSVFLFIFLESPQPYLAGAFVAFATFEITYLLRSNKRSKNQKIL